MGEMKIMCTCAFSTVQTFDQYFTYFRGGFFNNIFVVDILAIQIIYPKFG